MFPMLFVIFNLWAQALGTLSARTFLQNLVEVKEPSRRNLHCPPNGAIPGGLNTGFQLRENPLAVMHLRDVPPLGSEPKVKTGNFPVVPKGWRRTVSLPFTLPANTFGSPHRLLGCVEPGLCFPSHPWGRGNWRSSLTNALGAWLRLSAVTSLASHFHFAFVLWVQLLFF